MEEIPPVEEEGTDELEDLLEEAIVGRLARPRFYWRHTAVFTVEVFSGENTGLRGILQRLL